MRSTIIAAALLAAAIPTPAQEKLGREESLKYACILSANLKEMLNTPIPTDPDLKRPVAIRDESYGVLALPESKLTAESLGRVGKEPTTVGQLWMAKLVPLNDGQVIPASKLRMVHVKAGEREADVPCCALAVRKDAEGAWELLIYGKGSEPVMRVPMKSISAPQENPIEISAERNEDGGLITLKLLGKHEAKFMLTDPEKY